MTSCQTAIIDKDTMLNVVIENEHQHLDRYLKIKHSTKDSLVIKMVDSITNELYKNAEAVEKSLNEFHPTMTNSKISLQRYKTKLKNDSN